MSDTEDFKDEDFDPGDTEYEDERVSELQRIQSTLERILEGISNIRPSSDSSAWLWLVAIIFLLSQWSGSSIDKWTDKVWYSIRYDTNFDNIVIIKRPLDCDFFHAPLGSKGCEYSKKIEPFGADQRRALIQQAETEEEKREIAKRPNTVFASWEKTEF